MAITKKQITEALHSGVRAASSDYRKWSHGQVDLPEYLVVVEIAGSIHKKLGESESLRLEMQYGKVLGGAGFVQGPGAPLKAIGGNTKADLVLLKDGDKPTCVVEVKKTTAYQPIQKDLKRLRDVIYACRDHEGLLKHGFLSIYLSGDADSVTYQIDSVTNTVEAFFKRNSQRARTKPPNIRTWRAGEVASIVVEVTPRRR